MATHVMSVTDGTTTITLTSGSWLLSDYQMAYPRRREDGTYENVTETIELNAFGTSTTGVQTTVNALETMLQRAYNRQSTGTGDIIYLQFQVANEADTWRSELLGGEIEISPDTMRAWNQALALVRVHIARRYYWEGPETLARLVQQYSGQSSTEIAVYSYTSTRTSDLATNFIEFNGTQIGGVLPTPAIIYQSNSPIGQTRVYTDIKIALGKFRRPDRFKHMYEGQNIHIVGSTIADSFSSNGYYRRITTSTTPVYPYWESFPIQEQTGRTYRMIVNFRSYTAGVGVVYVRPVISMAGNTRDLWYGEEVLLPTDGGISRTLVDIGTVPIPLAPFGTRPAVLLLKLAIRSTAAGTVGIDYMQLTPTDGYRQLRPASYALTGGKFIVDHGIDEITYADEIVTELTNPFYTNNNTPLDPGIGPFIHLYPGQPQRMYFLRTLTSGALPGDALYVKVYYRPRRLTI